MGQGRHTHQDHRESEEGPLSSRRAGCGSQRKGSVVLCKTKQEILTSGQLNDKQGYPGLEGKVESAR